MGERLLQFAIKGVVIKIAGEALTLLCFAESIADPWRLGEQQALQVGISVKGRREGRATSGFSAPLFKHPAHLRTSLE